VPTVTPASALLATSTPQRRNHVRILFYGQSITVQAWTKQVEADLRARFPHADLEVANKAIGGFASQLLKRPAEHDLYPFYPDLLVFHVYGSHEDYDAIIKATRSRTTAEVLMQKDHVGAKWPLVQEGARKYLPIMIIGDGFSTRQGNLSQFNQNNLRFGSSLSWTKSSHNFKFGADFNFVDVDAVFELNFPGLFNFGEVSGGTLAAGFIPNLPTSAPALTPVQAYGAGIPGDLVARRGRGGDRGHG
jgi:hypothetical protein